MSHLDILLPFGLPPKELAPDLLRTLKTPAFATLLGKAKAQPWEAFDAFSRAMPHENWLARQCGLTAQLQAGNSPPVAGKALHRHGLNPAGGTWFMLHPVHIHIARDHLVLTNLRQLMLTEPESRALFESARPLFEEAGKALLYGDARTWFVRADDWAVLHTSTPDAASGLNVDIWMPKGDGERDWRRLQNEVQMQWHTEPLNLKREERGLKPVNSVWLWGGTTLPQLSAPASYTRTFNLQGWMQVFSAKETKNAHPTIGFDAEADAATVIDAAPEAGLVTLNSLLEAALAEEWSDWIGQMQILENEWFGPLLAALRSGKIASLSLVATHHTGLRKFTVTRGALRRFWMQPSLSKLTS